MKKILFIFTFILGFTVFAQTSPNDNRFAQSESENTSTDQQARGPGNPPGDDDLPIDTYIPVLIISAMGIIVGVGLRSKKVC